MKHIFKYLAVAVLVAFSSCELTELDHLDNPNGVSPENAETAFIFNSIQLDFKDFFFNASFNTMRPVRMNAMTGGNTYNNAYAPTTYNFLWNRAYSDLLPDLDGLIANTQEDLPTYAGASKVMKAYILMTLVDLFGNVPFSEAGKGVEIPSPIADDQKGIYDIALALLDEAIKDFGTPGPNIGSNDLFYGGDNAKWTAAANTMKLKWYMTTRLVNNPTSEINALIGNVIADASGDFQFQYGTNRSFPDSRSPFYANFYESSDNEYLSNYFMWSLDAEKGIRDPRTRFYFYRQDLTHPSEIDAFTLDCWTIPRPIHYTGPYPWCVGSEDGLWGRDHGNNDGIPPDGDRRCAYGLYPAGGKYDAGEGTNVKNSGTDGAGGQGIAPIMLSSFVDFMLAESALTLGTTGDPKAYLQSGIEKSMAKVYSFAGLQATAPSQGDAQTDIDAYIDLVMSMYDAAATEDDRLNVILKEYHIALWGNGVEAYNFYRRTGMPTNMQPTRDPSAGDFPRLMFYPADYVNLNANASQRAITEQVFWDTNPAGIYDF